MRTPTVHGIGLVMVVLVTAPAWLFSPTVANTAPPAEQHRLAQTVRRLPDWTPPATPTVRDAALGWIATRGVDELTRGQAEQIWQSIPEPSIPTDRLGALSRTIALADPRADRLVRQCAGPRAGIRLPEAAWLAEPDVDPLVSANLRLLLGRWLVQNVLYDEALVQLRDLEPEQVVDPATLLFCQAVVHHWMLDKEQGLRAIDRLLGGEQHGPRRYTALARLMRDDLEGLTEDSLDHIARRMEDIQRRLELGRAGPKVRAVEKGVIESLDKLIKQLEDQQQQCQDAGDALQSSRPADDSRLMGGLGPGRVTRKPLGGKSGWGDLPPKQREEALQEVGRQFPSHYRDVIEQYFRKMAAEEPVVD